MLSFLLFTLNINSCRKAIFPPRSPFLQLQNINVQSKGNNLGVGTQNLRMFFILLYFVALKMLMRKQSKKLRPMDF